MAQSPLLTWGETKHNAKTAPNRSSPEKEKKREERREEKKKGGIELWLTHVLYCVRVYSYPLIFFILIFSFSLSLSFFLHRFLCNVRISTRYCLAGRARRQEDIFEKRKRKKERKEEKREREREREEREKRERERRNGKALTKS